EVVLADNAHHARSPDEFHVGRRVAFGVFGFDGDRAVGKRYRQRDVPRRVGLVVYFEGIHDTDRICTCSRVGDKLPDVLRWGIYLHGTFDTNGHGSITTPAGKSPPTTGVRHRSRFGRANRG